jgi:hypothetical protein
MSHYVYRPKHPQADEFGMLDAAIAGPKHVSRAAPSVITDEMAPTRHMADGNYYSSKHKFRAATRAHGCIEIGSEVKAVTQPRKRTELSREQRKNDIRRAISQLR